MWSELSEEDMGDGNEALGDLPEESLASFRAVEEDSVGLGPEEDGTGGVGVVTADEGKVFRHFFLFNFDCLCFLWIVFLSKGIRNEHFLKKNYTKLQELFLD